MTQYQRIWEACRALQEVQPDGFTLEDIAVACYKMYPEHFGMRGHPEYPDTRKITTFLSGPNSILKREGLVKVTNHKSRYKLGLRPVNIKMEQLAMHKQHKSKATPTADADWIKRQLNVMASLKMRGEKKGDVNSLDAMEFLGLRAIHEKPGAAKEALKATKTRLNQIEQNGDTDQGTINFLNSVVNKITPIVHLLDRRGEV